MTTIPRVRDLPDLLTVVPLLAGFTPCDAVVLVCPTPEGRVALQRVPLPPPDHWSHAHLDARDLVQSVLPALVHADLRRLTLIGYLSDPMDQDYVGELLHRSAEWLADTGIDVMGVALVCEGSWWRPDCPCEDPECGEPQPVPSLHESAAATALIAEGAVVHESPEALLAPWVESDAEQVSSCDLAAATKRWTGRKGTARLRREALQQWRRVVHEPGAEFSQEDLAAVLWAARSVPERDALIAWLTPGDMPVETLDPDAWAAVQEALGEPASVAHEDRWTGWPVTQNLRRLTGAVPATCGAPVACLAGLWAWWHGDGIVARFLLERALDAEPGHTLSGLLLRLVHHGIPMEGSPSRRAGSGCDALDTTGRLG
ncbi:DUF4192 domain-containing protein [Kytococcus sedentarius]|uniref:DUF4192 domain-containing protein n=1 Tax=Kytococcus sedentarius TaxID=1276 RepID=UPI0035BC6F60